MAFPASPSNNDVHKEGNRAFVWDSTLGVWDQVREVNRSENKTITSGAIAQGNFTVVGDLVPSTPLSHRNMIINGGMQVWQRATAATTTGTGGGYKTVDRFKFLQNGAARWTSEKHALSLAELNTTGHTTALKLVCTTVDSDLTDNSNEDYNYFNQCIEAQDCQHLQYGTANAKTLTLSFWVKSNKTGIYTIALRKVDTTAYYYIKEYTISSADTWEKKTITITPTAGSTSFITGAGGIIANDNGTGLEVSFGLSWGSDFHGTDDSWQTAQTYATSNHVNWTDSTSNNFYITGVQLELGSNATPFEHRSYGDELARCLKYYENSYDKGYYPAEAVNYNYAGHTEAAMSLDGSTIRVHLSFKVTKRANVNSVTIYSVSSLGSTPGTGVASTYIGGGWGAADSASSVGERSSKDCNVGIVDTSSVTGLTYLVAFGWAADAEL